MPLPLFDRDVILVTVATCFAASHPVRAAPFHPYVINIADRENHEQARRAFQQGQIRSLSEITQQLRPELGGEVIEVELKAKRGRHYYKLKVLAPNGHVSELLVSATDGKIVERDTR